MFVVSLKNIADIAFFCLSFAGVHSHLNPNNEKKIKNGKNKDWTIYN